MSIGYYSYLALSQLEGVISKKGYEIDYEDVIFTSYFSQSFPESVVGTIRKDFDSSFYLCRDMSQNPDYIKSVNICRNDRIGMMKTF